MPVGMHTKIQNQSKEHDINLLPETPLLPAMTFKVLDDIVVKEIWLNPPWSRNVRTNVLAKFLVK